MEDSSITKWILSNRIQHFCTSASNSVSAELHGGTIVCSKDPHAPSEAEDARRQRFSESGGSIIESDAESQAASAVVEAGIDTDRIGERASAIGSTSQQAQELDTEMLRAELETGEQASERSDGSDTRARAIAAGVDSAVLDSIDTR